MTKPNLPPLDQELRLRLGRRFGSAIDQWLAALPAVLADLAEQWEIEWGPPIQRGSMSVVIRCRTADGRPAVLKVSPDRERIGHEAAALANWKTNHVPTVLAVDEGVGALMIDAVDPGTALAESPDYPAYAELAALLTSLHDDGRPDRRYPAVADRVDHLFKSGTKNYERRPDLVDLIPPELYARGRQLATRLAADGGASVLLHGDLTPVNVLDGGAARGLVAIDPAPCVGDPAFDTVDLVL